jgi:DMSO/TMAO reductase YedYZ heme-binding membrane subunit
MSAMAEEQLGAPMSRRALWTEGVLVGLAAACTSTLILLLAGALSGRGLHILTDVGMATLPSLVRAATGLSAALSYVLSHTLIYLLAGVVALALAGLADRVPPLVAGLLLVILIIEFGFLVFTTESQVSGRIDEVTWRSLLIAHAVGDVVFLLGLVRAHPTLRQAVVRGFEW